MNFNFSQCSMRATVPSHRYVSRQCGLFFVHVSMFDNVSTILWYLQIHTRLQLITLIPFCNHNKIITYAYHLPSVWILHVVTGTLKLKVKTKIINIRFVRYRQIRYIAIQYLSDFVMNSITVNNYMNMKLNKIYSNICFKENVPCWKLINKTVQIQKRDTHNTL